MANNSEGKGGAGLGAWLFFVGGGCRPEVGRSKRCGDVYVSSSSKDSTHLPDMIKKEEIKPVPEHG